MAFNSVIEAREAIRLFHFEQSQMADISLIASLAEATREASPVDTIVKAARALHLARETLDGNALRLGRDLTSFAVEHGWHNLADGSGTDMVRDFNGFIGAQ